MGQVFSSVLAGPAITSEYSERGGVVVFIEGDKKSLPSSSLEKNQLPNQHTALQQGSKRHPQLAVARKPQNRGGGLACVCQMERNTKRERVCLCLATGTVDASGDLAGLGCRTHTRQRSIRVLRHGAHHGAKRSSCCPSEKVGAWFLSGRWALG